VFARKNRFHDTLRAIQADLEHPPHLERYAKKRELNMDFKRNTFTGMVTMIPILVTLFVFSIFLDLLSDIGRPRVVVLANAVRPVSPEIAGMLLEVPWLSSALAILLTVGMFYLLGWSM